MSAIVWSPFFIDSAAGEPPAKANSLLPAQAYTKYDDAQERADAARYPFDADAVRRTKDADLVDPALLPALAWEYSDDLWNPNWGLQRQRNVAGGALALQRLKGTVAGLRGFLSVVDANLVQIITPPQGWFVGPDYSKADIDAWISKLPQIRILVGNSTGTDPDGIYSDACFAGDGYVTLDVTARELYGRRAILRKDGVDTPMRIVTTKTDVEIQNAVDFEAVSLLGYSPDGFFAGVSYAGNDFVDAVVRPAEIITYALDRSYVHEQSELHLSTLDPGLAPIDTKYERVSDTVDGGLAYFAGEDFAGDSVFAMIDEGWKLLADVIYLNDPSVSLPYIDTFGFAGVTRVGISPFTAEAMVAVSIPASFGDCFAGEMIVGEGYATVEDTTVIDAAQQAAVASLSARDKLLITFETTRPLAFYDGIPLDGSVTFESRLPAFL